jgi:hypothetical protein
MAYKNYNPRKQTKNAYTHYATPQWFRGMEAMFNRVKNQIGFFKNRSHGKPQKPQDVPSSSTSKFTIPKGDTEK